MSERGKLLVKGGEDTLEKLRKRKEEEKRKKKERKEKKEKKERGSKKNKEDRERKKRSRDGRDEVEKSAEKKQKNKKDHEEEESEEDEDLKHLTPAQRKFEMVRRRREKEQIKKMISKTHREKIDEFNSKLAQLSEHHDIPRISAAGQG